MRIVDLLHEQGIDLNFNPKNKAEAIDMLIDLMDKTGNLNDKQGYKEAILAREDLSTTGIGDGIAIPHGKTKAVKNASLAAAVSKEGVDYDALDGMPSHLFFMIAAPEGENEVHLEVLARLSTILMDEEFRKTLINAKDKKEFLNLIDKKEKAFDEQIFTYEKQGIKLTKGNHYRKYFHDEDFFEKIRLLHPFNGTNNCVSAKSEKFKFSVNSLFKIRYL